jgi:hypothetical protein
MSTAENFWDENPEDDASCEKYLNKKKTAAAAEINEEADDATPEVDEAEDEEQDATADEEDDLQDEEEDEEEEAEALAAKEEEPTLVDTSEEDPPTTTGKKMVKAKAAGSKITKADSIREVIAAKKKAGEELRPRDIIAVLNKKGIEVNASQVSITLRAMGIPPTSRGASAPTKANKPAKAAADTNGESTKSRATLRQRVENVRESAPATEHALSGKLLEAAADFIHEAGGYEQATHLLSVCNKVMRRV